MADVRPLRALRYDLDRVGPAERLIAPPYDVIDPEARARLAQNPYNVVHLILPEGPDPYTAAGRMLAAWIRDGVLVRDPEAAFYAYEQRFALSDGRPRRRLGFFARVRLEPWESGLIRPHEHIFPGPLTDRLRLLRATDTMLEAPFALYEDPDCALEPFLEEALQRPVLRACLDGVEHRLGRITEPAVLARFRAAMAERTLYMADGHHRYESLLAYWRERAPDRGDAQAFGLLYLSNAADPAFAILPTHRGLSRLGRELSWRKALPPDLWEPMAGAEALGQRLEREPTGLGVLEPDGSAYYVGPASALGRAISEVPEPLNRLPVVVLHELLLRRVLGLSPEQEARYVRYYKQADAVLEALRQGELELGFWLPPLSFADVRRVADAGLRLPQKATFFYPKIPSGLLFCPLE
ncbi:MAG: DUF1015 domain-containing protein [Bacteroidetes bacterium]|nr:DUF1015 domain-containing protein [Bacteroidota bacterium]MCX7906238.1 DUF1015 domain-containing protein [Bacteroidota bacterium]